MAAAPTRTSRSLFTLVVAGLCLGATTAFAQLAPPSNIHVTADCDRVTLTATPRAGAVAYVVRIWPLQLPAPLPDITVPSLPYVDDDIVPGEQRSYRVASVDAQSRVGTFGLASPGFIVLLEPAPVLTGTTPDGAQILGRPYTFTVSGNPPGSTTYTWKKNGTAIGAPSQTTYSIAAVAFADSGSYTCDMTNSCGTVTSNAIFLHVVDEPPSPTSVTATVGCGVVTLTWPHVNGAWAYAVSRSPNYSPPANEGPYPGKKVVNDNQFIDHPSQTDTYRYTVYTIVYGSTFGAPGRSTGNLPVTGIPTILQQPVGRTVETGTTVTLRMQTSGNVSATYTWRKDGQPVPGAQAPTYTIPNAQPSQSGSYDCLVCNNCGGCVATNAVTVHVCSTPVITVATADRHVYASEGSTATLTTATTLAQSMQWYAGGVALTEGGHFTGTTTGTLAIHGVTVADEGYYELHATGECTTVNGTAIQLSVSPCYDAPVLTQQPPPSQAVPIGQQATLSVQATCCVTPSYRWKRRVTGTFTFVDVPGGNQATLVIPAVTEADLGTYVCFVANRDRYEVSDFSELQATVAPTFGKMGSGSTCGGWNVFWNSNVPVSVTLQYWTGSCGNGPPATLPPTGYTTGSLITLPIPAGQQYYVQLSGVTPQNETVLSSCMLATARPPGPKLSASIGVQPYYVTMPFGTAVPIVVSVTNYGCTAFDGDITLASLTIAGIPQGALTADGDPAVPGTLLPAQIGPGQSRTFDVVYVPVSPPLPGVIVTHDITATVVSLASGSSPAFTSIASKLSLTSDYPK